MFPRCTDGHSGKDVEHVTGTESFPFYSLSLIPWSSPHSPKRTLFECLTCRCNSPPPFLQSRLLQEVRLRVSLRVRREAGTQRAGSVAGSRQETSKDLDYQDHPLQQRVFSKRTRLLEGSLQETLPAQRHRPRRELITFCTSSRLRGKTLHSCLCTSDLV